MFGMKPFGWLRSVALNPLFLMGISFVIHAFSIYTQFFFFSSGTQLGRKTRAVALRSRVQVECGVAAACVLLGNRAS